jgi:putative endonuclease
VPLPWSRRKQAYLKGWWSEKIAALYLSLKGYVILERRLKTPLGEIDLLVRQGNTLVAVEVKSRVTLEQASLSLTEYQQQRIEKALLFYLTNKPSSLDLRFDVVLISSWAWPRHIRGAWLSHEMEGYHG